MSSTYGVPSSQPKYAKPIMLITFIKGVKLKIDLYHDQKYSDNSDLCIICYGRKV